MFAVKKWFANSDSALQRIKVSLKCPITYRKTVIPVRGQDCKHIQVL